jgi:hypothetical protein
VLEVLHKRLKFCAYRFQFAKEITGTDQNLRKPLTLEVLSRIETYLNRISFFDELIICMCVTVNRHNFLILGGWGENLHDIIEHDCDSAKVNVWYAVIKHCIIGPLLLKDPMVTGYVSHSFSNSFSHLDGHCHTSLIMLMRFWAESFLIIA